MCCIGCSVGFVPGVDAIKGFFYVFLDVEILYHSDMSFGERLYGPLDVDVCRIKLHEPLSAIVKQPLLYVRDMVPKACFQALVKLEEVRAYI